MVSDRLTGSLASSTQSLSGSLSVTSQHVSGTLNQYVLEHGRLTGRAEPEQHPIEAITNLEPELAWRPSTAMSNAEIQAIMNT